MTFVLRDEIGPMWLNRIQNIHRSILTGERVRRRDEGVILIFHKNKGAYVLEEEDRKEIIKLQEATHTSVIAFVLSLFIPLVGLILGLKAKSEIDKSEHTKSGSAFAIAAIWIGAIGTLAWAALLAALLLASVSGHGWGFGNGFDGPGMRHHQSFDGYTNQQQPDSGMMNGYGSGTTPND
jgi:Domain of unknown function (DUF4190)